jgi:hypothetical protein
MLKKLVVLMVLAGALAAPALAVPSDNTVRHFNQSQTLGFFRGQTVEYLDFGVVKLKAGNKLAPIWAITNAADGQRNIIDTVPGRKDYSQLWEVNLVTWKDGVTPRLLRSAAEVKKALAAGEATVKKPGIVVDCPVV